MKWLRILIDWTEQPNEFHEAACLFVQQLDEHDEDALRGAICTSKTGFHQDPRVQH